jgi:hypothetical protein
MSTGSWRWNNHDTARFDFPFERGRRGSTMRSARGTRGWCYGAPTGEMRCDPSDPDLTYGYNFSNWRSGRGSNSGNVYAVARCSTQLTDSTDPRHYSALQRSQNWVRFGSAPPRAVDRCTSRRGLERLFLIRYSWSVGGHPMNHEAPTQETSTLGGRFTENRADFSDASKSGHRYRTHAPSGG